MTGVQTCALPISRAAELIERERITSFTAPAAMTGDLVREAQRTQRDLSSLVAVGGGGAPRNALGALGGGAFDRAATTAFVNGKNYKPGARSGFPYKPEHSANYWQEGGQGHRPLAEDFVEVDPRRVEQEFFDPKAQEQAAALGRQGRHREALQIGRAHV